MTTTVVKTIGSGGDYATVALWISYLNITPNLVSADNIQQGQLMNQEFSGSGTVVDFSSTSLTTDATRYVELTTASGASFRDNAGVRTNPLLYNASNGAGIRGTTSGYTLSVGLFDLHLTNLQVLGDTGSAGVLLTGGGITKLTCSNCIFGGTEVVLQGTSGSATLNNCLIYNSNGANNRAMVNNGAGGTTTLNDCTLVVPSGVSVANFVECSSSTLTLTFTGSALFGVTTAFLSGGGSATVTYNHVATNLGVPSGTGNIGSLTYANQFVSNVNDFRQHATLSGLHGTGVTIGGITTDISGLTRNVSTPDIGAWELSGGGGGGGGTGGGLLLFGGSVGWTPTVLGAAAAWKAGNAIRRNATLSRRRLLLGKS